MYNINKITPNPSNLFAFSVQFDVYIPGSRVNPSVAQLLVYPFQSPIYLFSFLYHL